MKESLPEVEQLVQLLGDEPAYPWDELLAAVRHVPLASEQHEEPHRVRQAQTLLNAEQKVEAVRRYVAGEPVKAICHDLNIHKTTLTRIWQAAGVPRRERNFNEDQKREAYQLYREGLNYSQIGRRLGVSKGAVRVYIQGVRLVN